MHLQKTCLLREKISSEWDLEVNLIPVEITHSGLFTPTFVETGIFFLKAKCNHDLEDIVVEISPYSVESNNMLFKKFEDLFHVDECGNPSMSRLSCDSCHVLEAGMSNLQQLIKTKEQTLSLPIVRDLYLSGGMAYQSESDICYLNELRRAERLNFGGYKFRPKVPNAMSHFARLENPPEVDWDCLIHLTAKLSMARGKNIPLFVDLGCRLSPNKQVDLQGIDRLVRLGVKVLEEPFGRDPRNYATAFARKNRDKIALGEHIEDERTLRQFTASSGFSIYQPDIALLGYDKFVRFCDIFINSVPDGKIFPHCFTSFSCFELGAIAVQELKARIDLSSIGLMEFPSLGSDLSPSSEQYVQQ